MSDPKSIDAALALHDRAARDYAEAAEAVPPGQWREPMAAGKWSPAQVTDHLIRAYEVLMSEMQGGAGMAIRTRPWQRILLRLILMPRLLRGAPFPRGARAPREIRPVEPEEDQEATIARFRDHADRFREVAEATHARDPRQRVTHAYFGASSLRDGIVFCAQHIVHHHRQVSGRNPSVAGR